VRSGAECGEEGVKEWCRAHVREALKHEELRAKLNVDAELFLCQLSSSCSTPH
jgi:hypothetical protein